MLALGVVQTAGSRPPTWRRGEKGRGRHGVLARGWGARSLAATGRWLRPPPAA